MPRRRSIRSEGGVMEMSREQALAVYGPVVVRMADRMLQFRQDRARHMLNTRGALISNIPEDLGRHAEAAALLAIVTAHKGLSGCDAHGDAGEGERLWGLAAGHVLTEQDVKDIECLM